MTSASGAARFYRALAERKLVDRNGREMPGHLDDSATGSRRTVVVLHDFFGLTAHTRGVARRLAGEGFIAFAPDLYRGRTTESREEAATLAQSIAWNQVAIELGLIVEALKDRTRQGPVAVLGFAMGGAAALVAAAAVPKLCAAITFYGIPQDVIIDNPRLRIQGHFAARDQKCTAARVAGLDRSLNANGVGHEFFSYPADNGFCSPLRPDCHAPEHAEVAWSRAIAFLNSNVREQDNDDLR